MPGVDQRYWAFISYSHEDSRWADRLHRQLERFAVPRRLVGHATPAGPAPRRFRPIFKDREELGAAPDLSERLNLALGQSAYLIVICSPAAARSRWVDLEIRRFMALHGRERILAVIASGEPFASDDPSRAAQECLPKALRTNLDAVEGTEPERFEPAAADLRRGKGGARLAILKLLSGMLGIDLGELVHRETRRRGQQLIAFALLSLAAAAVLGAMAIAALGERNDAIAQRGQAEGLIEFMIGDLRKKLEPAGRLDALDAVGSRALSYYAAQKGLGSDAQSLGRRARVLHMLGEIRDRRGDLGAALRLFEEASESTGELLARRPNDPQRIYDQAQSDYWVGYVAWRRGEDEEALREYREYVRLADRLVAINPRNADWRAEVGYANLDCGVVLLDEGRADEAAAALDRALAIGADLVRRAPADRDRQFDLAQVYAWLAAADYHRGRLDASLADRMAERAVYVGLIETTPSDESAVLALAINRYSVGQILMTQGRADDAIASLQGARADLDRLIATAPDDTQYQERAVTGLLLLARALLEKGDLAAAEAAARQALNLAEHLVRKDPTVSDWRGPRLGGARIVLIEIAAAGAASHAAQETALAPAVAEARRLAVLSSPGKENLTVAEVAAEAAMLAGDHASLAGEAGAARPLWAAAKARMEAAGAAGLPAGDRAQALLRELDYRLSLLRPPEGPAPAGEPLAAPRRKALAGGRVDYRW